MTISGADLDAVLADIEPHLLMDMCRKCEIARRRSDERKMCARGQRAAFGYGTLQDQMGIDASGGVVRMARR